MIGRWFVGPSRCETWRTYFQNFYDTVLTCLIGPFSPLTGRVWLTDWTPQLLKTVVPSLKILKRSQLHLWQEHPAGLPTCHLWSWNLYRRWATKPHEPVAAGESVPRGVHQAEYDDSAQHASASINSLGLRDGYLYLTCFLQNIMSSPKNEIDCMVKMEHDGVGVRFTHRYHWTSGLWVDLHFEESRLTREAWDQRSYSMKTWSIKWSQSCIGSFPTSICQDPSFLGGKVNVGWKSSNCRLQL